MTGSRYGFAAGKVRSKARATTAGAPTVPALIGDGFYLQIAVSLSRPRRSRAMPYVYLYQCGSCGFDAEITVCREFQRLPDGSRIDYQYPDPDLYEWPPRRVAGLWSHLWCSGCGTVRPLITVELEDPAEHPVQAFLAAEARGLTGAETGPCPECGAQLLLEPESAPCPRCPEGRLTRIGEYEP